VSIAGIGYLAGMSGRQIDWATAEVDGGTLTVGLDGEAPKHWSRRLRVVLALLEHTGDGWGKITPRKNAVRVAEVREGTEEDLRHLLDGALQQVNADLSSDGDEESEPHDPDPEAETDRRLTETFRSFASSRAPRA
jgi:hypothetical protein